ncbi:MAG TPA: SOS response-associated peptidase [Nitrospirales bacterium]|nr:SOS response-associated peptidase [Nitrospirales bacterium]
MCGRYTLKTPVERLAEKFQFSKVIPLKPRYNVAPSQPVAVVRRLPDDGDRKLAMLLWGLIPAWAKFPNSGAQPINAKAETAAELPMFRDAFRRRRCLVPADGFFEWKQEGERKHPVYICLKDGEPFAIAGLWEHWESQDGQVVESCTLLTTAPNELLEPIHNRMPVILHSALYDLWVDTAVQQVDRLKPLLVPFPADQMTAYPVNLRVNNPKHDDPLCLEPI